MRIAADLSQDKASRDAFNRRLDSWKEIAAYLDREERTVRRWEKERSLPVHRIPGKPRGGVYAFTQELTQWLQAPEPTLELTEDALVPMPIVASPGITASAPQTQPPVPTRGGSRYTLRFLFAATALLVVALSVSMHQSPSLKGEATRHRPTPAALDQYLKGRYQWSRRSPESLREAVACFNRALDADPDLAQAYAGLADTYNLLREFSVMRGEEAYPKAMAAARKALELDDSLPEAHRAMAFLLFNWAWDYPGAEREFRRAIALDPQDAGSHHWFGTSLGDLGRFDESLKELDKARRLNPASAAIQADRGIILFKAGRGEEALAVLRQLAVAEPAFISPHRYLAGIAFATKDLTGYLAEARIVANLIHDQAALETLDQAERGLRSGGQKGFYRSLERAQTAQHQAGLISGFTLAQTCAMAGEPGKALVHLEADYLSHNPNLPSAGFDPALKSLRDDPVFRELMKRIGLSVPKQIG
jgi:tetratricopeptide (TPR) repeat protein